MLSRNVKRIIRNPYLFSVISKAVGVLIGFIFTIFQARFLGAEIKGQVTTVNSIVSIASIFMGFGICNSYPYYKRKSQTDLLPVFLQIALLLLGVYSLISTIAILFFYPASKLTAVLILTPIVTYDGFISYISLIEMPNRRNATDMAIMLTELVILLVLWLVASPTFVIGVVIITSKNVIKAVLFSFWWRDKLIAHTEDFGQWLIKTVKFGFFPMLAVLMTTLNYRIDVLMLDGNVPDAAIGVYSIGVMLSERVWLATDAMKGVMVSNISKGKDARETIFVIRICNTFCLFMMIAIIALGKPFIDLIFGAEYSGAYQITLILLAGVFPMNYYKMIDAYIVAMGKQVISFFLLSVGVVSNIISNFILIPPMGIYGAGVASAISYTLCSILFTVYFCHTTGLSFREMLLVNRNDIQKIRMLLPKAQKEA